MSFDSIAARRFYDRFGAKQDAQLAYEKDALDDLVTHADFEHADAIIEFGCGTGRFAAELLSTRLPRDATYAAFDLSSTMISIARSRLAGFGSRATVVQTEGQPVIPLPDSSCDRFVSNYVVEILSPDQSQRLVAEARRVLVPGGLAAVASITTGVTWTSRVVMGTWRSIHAVTPSLVGGCHPIDLRPFFAGWHIVHRNVIVARAIASEVLVAERP